MRECNACSTVGDIIVIIQRRKKKEDDGKKRIFVSQQRLSASLAS